MAAAEMTDFDRSSLAVERQTILDRDRRKENLRPGDLSRLRCGQKTRHAVRAPSGLIRVFEITERAGVGLA
jgi:hypothetical protein